MRFALAILIASTTPLAALAADITLREDAAGVPGVLVRLGDVATIRGADADRLAESPLMPSPVPGTTQRLSAGAIRDLLKAQGIEPRDHYFRGAFTVQVTTPLGRPTAESAPVTAGRGITESTVDSGTAFRYRGGIDAGQGLTQVRPTRRASLRDSQAIEEAVKSAIQTALDARRQPGESRLAVRGVDVTSTTLNELVNQIGQPLTAAFAPTAVPLPGAMQCRVWPAEGLAGEPYLVVADLVEQPMRVVATTPLSRGALVTTSAVQLEVTPLEEIGRPNAIGFAKLEDVLGKETTRPVRVGEVFSDTNTAPPMMVRRNEEVMVVSGGGGVSVSMRVVATQDGRVGDLVTVQTLDKDERFAARVVGPRRLAVLSGGPAVSGDSLTGELQ